MVTDPNIALTFGNETSGGTEDVVYVQRSSDIILWEGAIRTRVLPDTKAQNLTVLLQIFSYLAFTGARHPASIVKDRRLSAPSF